MTTRRYYVVSIPSPYRPTYLGGTTYPHRPRLVATCAQAYHFRTYDAAADFLRHQNQHRHLPPLTVAPCTCVKEDPQ